MRANDVSSDSPRGMADGMVCDGIPLECEIPECLEKTWNFFDSNH